MNKLLVCIIVSLFTCNIIIAQVKKLPIEINSIDTKEVIELKYNAKNQLIYFNEKGIVTYREFTLKYDKMTNQLSECIMNEDRGQLILNSKYSYDNANYIKEEVKSSGKKTQEKGLDHNNIYIDESGRLSKTIFDDGKLWEEFVYDKNNNITTYTLHPAFGDSELTINYEYNKDKSIFSDIENLPLWFWTLHISNMKWCSDFIGNNNASQFTTVDSRFGTDTVDITYEYDSDKYPVKQFYNRKLVREFKYKSVK